MKLAEETNEREDKYSQPELNYKLCEFMEEYPEYFPEE